MPLRHGSIGASTHAPGRLAGQRQRNPENAARAAGAQELFLSGDDSDAKQTVAELLTNFGWPKASQLDLGGITTARGPEYVVPLPVVPSSPDALSLSSRRSGVGRLRVLRRAERYEIELDGEIMEGCTKLVASHARLLRAVGAWNDELRDAYTRMCADRAHEFALGASPPLEAWDAVIEPSVPEGPALLGFVAARFAEERDGAAAYHAERGRQTAWLVERLGL